ncbi:hypothetical protein [Simiduia agarivorans]|uniref:Uncharacterized protein n=1 Tax=Simiduia agarivorans (strain DSM 21679 / JCM 13881 / BCRC 17597 / SA1) TaxID=1117647 RepID=K4KUG7_SIMAS|nr:hypothetical protein [Simiduia agarivorans]AFU97607.2 hypothetical protein M5M_01940 [Simiduia agarivorans SA1 = DSM 21679]
MNLPDFDNFAPLQALREKMQAVALGHYEFFDPKRHLTGDERLALVQGLRLPLQAIRPLDDKTFAFKNARVILWSADVMQQSVYHLCFCDQMTLSGDVVVGTQPPDVAQVCAACLDHLQYEGHNSHRHRHQDYYAQVRKNFSAQDFFSRFVHYPVDG